MAWDEFRLLPAPGLEADATLADALADRRTVRSFTDRPIDLAQVAQLLWAAQGITSPEGFRTAPSAGALYPLEVHLVSGAVKGLEPGAYRYLPQGHKLMQRARGDLRADLARVASRQGWIADAPAVFVVCAVYERTSRKYGDRAMRYVHMEVGHAAQNLLLEAVAMGLAGGIVGAFDDAGLQQLLKLSEGEQPLIILPVGYEKSP